MFQTVIRWTILVLCIVSLTAFPAFAQETGADSTTVAVPERGAFATVTEFMTDLFDISTSNAREKALRIVVILLIGLIAKLAMSVVQGVGRFMVYSTWGPLKFIFRNHQRSITWQTLVVNLIKYVIYFTALGYILRELGIDYRTYLASLSLIGIAIGFGSQGLVQDIVTGFFILFENQFVVGDMVEIAGQTGVVEDIGLRTTRIRNYVGGIMIFPNRNIAVVGRYPKGGMEATVDVAHPVGEKAEGVSLLLEKIGVELGKQFREIILEAPTLAGAVTLQTGEQFLRIHALIWPGQQWVIDSQLVPRIREIFARENVTIPGDRIVTFYHTPDKEEEILTVLQKIKDIF